MTAHERIVVLDGYTLNPGDIDWGPISLLGDLRIHDRTPDAQILERCQGATCLLLNKTPMNRVTLTALPDLKYIGVLATGYNVVDINTAMECGVVVSNIPTYGTNSVAQHVVALLLEFARGVGIHNKAVHEGEWASNADWCFARQPMFELTGRTLGIVGIGRIGQAVARIAAAMGMKLIAHDLFWPDADKLSGLSVEQVELDDLFSRSDAISLHCPLTADNQYMVNARMLSRMKADAILINTSRGPLIDNHALAEALRNGVIAGAALDVLDVEPPPADNPLLSAPHCVITPHIAWYAVEARQRLMQIAAENLKSFLEGSAQNVVG